MENDNTEDLAIKNSKNIVQRDEHGRLLPGVVLNPNGRPKKGLTLTDIAREILEEELPNGMTRKEALMKKVAQLAYEGNETMIKLLWNYIDGLPLSRTELTGKDGEKLPTPILQINNVLPNDSDDKDKQSNEKN